MMTQAGLAQKFSRSTGAGPAARVYDGPVSRLRTLTGQRRQCAPTRHVAGVTDIGSRRERNEDEFFISTAGVLLVADGLGGLPAGEVASSTAVAAAATALTSHAIARLDEGSAREALAAAFRAANAAVESRARRERACDGMATTLVAGLISGPGLYLAHVGDVRAYRLRGTQLRRLTEDHTRAWEWVLSGELSEQEAKKSSARNALTRVLGCGAVEAALVRVDLVPDDVVLLCSDGLWEPVSEQEIERILSNRSADALARATALTDAALFAGGPDNITAVVYQHVVG